MPTLMVIKIEGHTMSPLYKQGGCLRGSGREALAANAGRHSSRAGLCVSTQPHAFLRLSTPPLQPCMRSMR